MAGRDAPHGQGVASRPRGVSEPNAHIPALRFVRCDPEEPPAADLLAAMRAELNEVYETFDRLDNPPLAPAELRPPRGGYYVGYEGIDAVAGGGVRRLGRGLAEIKRMYVCPHARSRCGGGTAPDARRCGAFARLHVGPPRHRAETASCAAALPWRGLRGGAGLQQQPVCLLLGAQGADLSNTVAIRGAPVHCCFRCAGDNGR